MYTVFVHKRGEIRIFFEDVVVSLWEERAQINPYTVSRGFAIQSHQFDDAWTEF